MHTSVLLRLLLGLLLVLNGIGTSMAATAMLLVHATHATQSAPHSDAAGKAAPPCHDTARPVDTAGDMDMAGMGDLAMAATDVSDTNAPASHQPPPDCCQSMHCDCACMQSTAAAMVVLLLPTAAPADGEQTPAMALDHTAPALPHLIRPPIG